MHETAFSPANILLPQDCGLTKWAVVACDQYTSQPESAVSCGERASPPADPAGEQAGK